MSRTLRPLAAFVLIAFAAVISAGCGGAGSTVGNSSITTTREKAVRFAECMRANGVGAFPDPGASGSFTIDGIANGSSVDTSSEAFERALTACKDLEPAGFTGTKVTPQQTTARLEFAQCVRDNGVPDFPDPTSSGPLVDTNRIASSNSPAGMSILNTAMRKCGRYAASAGVHGSQR